MVKIKQKQKQLLSNYLPLFERFAKATSKERKSALLKLNNSSIQMLCECCLNGLFNKDFVRKCCDSKFKKCKNMLAPYKCHLCILAVGKLSALDRRMLCIYLRNCLGVLISILLPSLKAMLEK